jgi:hypothetical protein
LAQSRARLAQALPVSTLAQFASAAADLAGTLNLPGAPRHPRAWMLGALLVGGLLGWSRPWRR